MPATTTEFVECDTCGDFALYGGVCVCDVEPEYDSDADRDDYADEFDGYFDA